MPRVFFGSYEYPVDDYELDVEDSTNPEDLVKLLRDMVTKLSIFPHKIDSVIEDQFLIDL